MKKLLSVAALLLCITPAFAQLYIRSNVGYSLPINSQMIGTETNQNYDPVEGYTGTIEGIYGSYGSGLSFQVALGGSLNGSLGYDIEAGYLLSKKNTTGYSYSDDLYESGNEYTSYARSFQFAPSLTFTAGTGNIQPYTRMGPVVGITTIHEEESDYDTYSGFEQEYEYKLSGGMSIGFKGVVGVIFSTGKKIQFFTEVAFTGMSYSPKEREWTHWSVNGDKQDIPEDQKITKYEKEIDYDEGEEDELQDKFSMGSIGLQAGIRFMLK